MKDLEFLIDKIVSTFRKKPNESDFEVAYGIDWGMTHFVNFQHGNQIDVIN